MRSWTSSAGTESFSFVCVSLWCFPKLAEGRAFALQIILTGLGTYERMAQQLKVRTWHQEGVWCKRLCERSCLREMPCWNWAAFGFCQYFSTTIFEILMLLRCTQIQSLEKETSSAMAPQLGWQDGLWPIKSWTYKHSWESRRDWHRLFPKT